MATVILQDGDIFQSGAHILVNPVNCVGVMGKGLAQKFRIRYPNMYKQYKEHCRTIGMSPGNNYIYEIKAPVGFTKYIFNVATKNHWSEDSSLAIIDKAMYSIVYDMLYADYSDIYKPYRQSEKSRPNVLIAIPALGCGEGKLEFKDVYPIIQRNVSRLEGEVWVYPPQ